MKKLNNYIQEKLVISKNIIIESFSNELFNFLQKLDNSNIIFANDEIKEKYDIKELVISKTLYDNNDYITLDKIIINNRNKGHGTEFMEDLCRWADMYGKILCLTPSDSFGASSISRLNKFYKKFGFVENKGKNSNFNIKEKMYRK